MRLRFLIPVCLAVLVLGACSAPDIALPSVEPLPTDEPTSAPPTGVVRPPDQGTGGLARLDKIELLQLESFPVQVSARLTGSLPDGCTMLEPAVVSRQENVFTIELRTAQRGPAAQACTQALVPFEQAVRLETVGLKAGVYQVVANGLQSSFSLAQDNVLVVPPLKGSFESGLAAVESVEILLGSAPAQVQVAVQGYLPDGCTTLQAAQVTRQENTFSIQLATQRPNDLLCTQMIVPYQQLVPLDVAGLPRGAYHVMVNGVAASFELTADNP